MGKSIISSLSRCDMCGKRCADLWPVGGLELCSKCKRTMKQCDNQKGSGEVKEVPSASSIRWTVRRG